MIILSPRKIEQALVSSLKVCAAIYMLVIAAQPLSAADIVVKEVGGVPVMRCKIRYGRQYIDTHVIFDVSQQEPMVIHSMTIRGLGLHPMMVQGKTADLEFDANVRLQGIPIQITRDTLLETMTRVYADDLNQVPVTAIIGLGALKGNVVELDLPRGLLRTLKMASVEATANEMPCQILPSGLVVKGIGPEGTEIVAQVTTKQMDSEMSRSLLEKARKIKINRISLEVGEIDFGGDTAFRFPLSSLPKGPTDINAVIGLGAIRNYAVTIWPARQRIAFIRKRKSVYPRSEQTYFYALADKDYAGVKRFIEAHNKHRLLDEAVINLWKMRSADASSTTQELKTILNMVATKYDSIRRATALSQVSDSIETSEREDRDELSMYALTLAMAQSDTALNNSTVHSVHLRLGKKAYAKGDLKTARRHLLSAAFGLPKDAECNFWLAEVYREMGKHRRAWSRYYQALVDGAADDDMKAKALQRIELLNSDPEFRKTFTMLMAEQYTSGRSPTGEFHAPYRYKLEKNQFPGHVRLLECFVDSNKSYTAVQQMAFHALAEYFEGEVAYIEYHLNDRLHSEAAVARQTYYEEGPKHSTVLDGKPTEIPYVPPRSGRLMEKVSAYYKSLKAECLKKTPASSSGWTLGGALSREGQMVAGTVSVTGEGDIEKVYLHAIVCERSVMAVQDNGVLFHRFVARSALTPTKGLPVAEVIKTPLKVSIDAEVLAKQIPRSGTFVDARLLTVIVFLQRQTDGRILTTETFSLPQEEEVF